jgi:5'-nucleotidase
VIKSRDPKGEPIYWVGPAGGGQDAGEGTDFHAIAQGLVSVTPIKIDLTDHDRLRPLSDWLERNA